MVYSVGNEKHTLSDPLKNNYDEMTIQRKN